MKHLPAKRHLATILKIALGLLLLYLSFQRVDWPILLDALRSVSGLWLVIAILSVLLSLALKVLRWDLLLHNYQLRLPLRRLISAFFLGQAANILLVIRGGEIVRVTSAHQPGQNDWVEISATIAIEKYLDLLFLVLLMLAMATNLPPLALETMGSLYPLLIIMTILLLLAILFAPTLWRRFFPGESKTPWLAKVQRKLDQFLQASLWLREPSKLLPSLGITLLIWVVMALTNRLVLQSLAINLGWDAALLVLILVYIGVLPALMPGNLGPFVFFAQLALIPYAVPNERAVAFAIILYAIVTLPPLLISGLLLLLPNRLKPEVPHA